MSATSDMALEVADGVLSVTGEAILSGAFDRFSACFRLPYALAAMEGARILETREDLRRVFGEVHRLYTDLGVARLDRWVEAALFDGPDHIRTAQVTHLLSPQGGLLRPPFTALVDLVRHGGRWLIAGKRYSVETESDHGRALLGEDALPGSATEPDTPSAALCQEMLDRVTQAYLTGDFEALVAMVQLPLFVQASHRTQVFRTREDLGADFRRYATEFHIHRVTDVVRRVTRTEMLGARRISAGFRTHILSEARLVVPSYRSAMTVEQGDDLVWRITSIMHPMGHLTLADKSEAEFRAKREGGEQ